MRATATERLTPSDYRFLAVCLVLAGVSAWYATKNFYRAFPEASIDFRVNRDDGRALAARFLSARRFDIAGYREASRFDFDDHAKTFLEREAGLERANKLMSTRVRLWHWSYRWFRPQQKEEFRADITPAGDVASFTHELPEDAARADVGISEARALAENFLRTGAHRDPASLDFVEVNETARPHRTDRTFVWKERDFTLRDATYRVWVTTLGGEIGGFGEYLKVPEQWQRDYQRLRSKNAMAQDVDQAVMVFLMVAMLGVILVRTRRQDVKWRRAATIGLVGMALAFCASLNSFPLQEFGFRTTDSYQSFLSREFLNALIGAVSVGGFLFLIAAGAEPVYREAYGGQISIGNLFRPRGLRTRRFFKGAVLGATLACIFIAYQTIFYLTAYHFGAWSPADVPYSDELNTKFPWLFVLFGGYLPAVFEEFTFRMFAIPFLRKIVRWLPAAVVLAGFIWGFGHSSYPQQPFFIRGVEVGIGGVALGIIMLRWGILPTLVWHYSVDALYSAMLMLRSHSLYFKLSGAVSAGVVVLPIVIALIAYWRKGGFETSEGLLNSDEPRPIESPATAAVQPVDAPVPHSVLPRGTRLAALAVFAAGLLVLFVSVERFGASPKYKLDAQGALRSADAFLRDRGLDPARFRHVVSTSAHWGGDDSLAAKYFLEHVPLARSSKLFEQYRPVRYWSVRYFRPLDQETVQLAVHPETGAVTGFVHTLPEDRPGADFPDEAARQIAAAFAAGRGIDLRSMDLKENSSEKKKARRDHTLVWEARPGDARNVAETHYRTEIRVAGDAVTSWRDFWKIPEAFSRDRERQNWVSLSIAVIRIATAAGLAFCVLWLFIHNVRRGLIPWRTTLLLAAAAAVLSGAGDLLRVGQVYENYNTAIPLATFQGSVLISIIITAVGMFLAFGLGIGFLASFFPDALHAFRSARRRVTVVDAAVAALAACGFALIAGRLELLLDARFHPQPLLEIAAPPLLESVFPALSGFCGAIEGAVGLCAVAAVCLVVLQRLPRFWILPAVLAAGVALLPDEVRTPAEFLVAYTPVLVAIAAAAIFCRWFGRRNYLAYALVAWAAGIRSAASELLGNPGPAYQIQGWIVLGVASLCVLWLFTPMFRGEVKSAAHVTGV